MLIEIAWLYAAAIAWFVILIAVALAAINGQLPRGSSVGFVIASFVLGLVTWLLTFPHGSP